ncbi:thioesterase superfamily protein [Acidovorax delafieldii 2AN]|uniref:Thioesterase superfamily protein n=1 Tax=Acidovorax delafieldii 2AN TaxID=573060 RepID=C5SZW3_ACIDE|nr:thioesterase superfamily protein [Acidovorax delafieldii 2AN]
MRCAWFCRAPAFFTGGSTLSVLVEPETSAPADSQLLSMIVVDMVWPDQSNHHGTLFGGAALSMLDRMAFIVGSKVLRGSVVTAAVGRLDFAAPAPAGHLVECRAQVLHRGRRSVTVDTRLIAEDLLSGTRTQCLSGEFVMVRQADEAPADAAEAVQAKHEACAENATMACATVAEIVFPGHVNHRDVLHGGPAMAWMAKAGFVAATRQVRCPVVMAGTEQLDFVASARVGDVVEVTANVIGTGRRSIRVQVDMWAESSSSGERRLCASAPLTYVAIEP